MTTTLNMYIRLGNFMNTLGTNISKRPRINETIDAIRAELFRRF